MRKRGKILILVLSGAAALAPIVCFARDKEPSYQSRSLSEWYLQWAKYSESKDHEAETQEAAQAIRQIGTNALPILLKRIRYEPSSFRKGLGDLVDKLPSAVSESRFVESLFSIDSATKRYDAANVFVILGPQASPAVAELTTLMHQTNSADTAQLAAYCLAVIGDAGLPSLLAALANPQHPSSRHAAHGVGYGRFGTNIAGAVPLLVRCAADSDQDLVVTAITSLGRIKLEPHVAIPALTNALHSKSFRIRSAAASSLGRFGSQAYCAVPALSEVLTDSDYTVRVLATNALLLIAPEALTNAVSHDMGGAVR